MVTEYETKVLDIDTEKINNKLLELGAKKVPKVLMKRWIFDIDSDEEEWIRLRDNGKIVTICYKKKNSYEIGGTEEIEFMVGDFDEAYKLLSKLPFRSKKFEESKRTLYKLEGIEFTIDEWPRIPKYLEVESKSEEKVKEGLSMLGLIGKDAGNITVVEVYKRYGIDLNSFDEIKFEE